MCGFEIPVDIEYKRACREKNVRQGNEEERTKNVMWVSRSTWVPYLFSTFTVLYMKTEMSEAPQITDTENILLIHARNRVQNEPEYHAPFPGALHRQFAGSDFTLWSVTRL